MTISTVSKMTALLLIVYPADNCAIEISPTISVNYIPTSEDALVEFLCLNVRGNEGVRGKILQHHAADKSKFVADSAIARQILLP